MAASLLLRKTQVDHELLTPQHILGFNIKPNLATYVTYYRFRLTSK